MRTPNPDIPSIPNTPEVGARLSFGPVPLVLFPVRLETRFFPQADGTSELRIRVYPDKIHIDSHEPQLTDDEVTWGQHFWEQTWRAADNEERAKAAWRQLAERYDPPRAAWIAHMLQPLNPDDRPKTPIGIDDPLPNRVRFPTPPTQAETWMRAPETRVLPNTWVALGYKDGRLVLNVTGGPIQDPLAVGPDPSPSAKADELGIDERMKWMVDFAAAEQVGMGIRAKLGIDAATAGLDFLIVFGVKDSLESATDWSPRLTQLLTAHHYTNGLSFLTPGTPSNNTQDAPSGFSSNDPGQEASYRAEREAEAFVRGDGSNGDLLATAFALAGDLFTNLTGTTTKDQLDARQMNTSLWQATWGYFLLQMLGVGETSDSPLTDEDIAWVRSHFIDFVRAYGPLPGIRVGRQPYGVLPVTSLSVWKPPIGKENELKRDTTLRDFLLRLRDIWRRNFPDVPRLGRTDDTATEKGIDKDLIEVLSMDGLSSNYSLRNLMGRHYLEHLLVFLSADFFLDIWNNPGPSEPPEEEPPEMEEPDPDLPPRLRAEFIRKQRELLLAFQRRQREIQLAFARERAAWVNLVNGKRNSLTDWWNAQEQLANKVLPELGITWHPRLGHGVFAPPVAKLSGALVQGDQSPSLSPNYIEALLAARDLNKIRFSGLTLEQPPPYTLLHLLLRHSMLLEYTSAGARLLMNRGLLQKEQRRELELVDLPLGQLSLTIWRQMARKISVTDAAEMELGQYLLGSTPDGEPDLIKEPDLRQLSEFRASLQHLKSLSVANLEKLMAGTLDLCSHRLDAWITSFATKRLADLRQADPTGVLFGGYGWVMNLKPAPAPTQVIPQPPGESDPVFQSPDNAGLVHTPSLTQAATVAVLRSGHLTHAGTANDAPNDLMAIDLSSERVRLASSLLDGVRQGQPLGALLGYRFERRLQEDGKPEFIATFRELAPLVARKLEPPEPTKPLALEAIAANNVVDGLALLRRLQQAKSSTPPQWTKDTIPFGQQVGPQKVFLPPADPDNPDFKVLQAELTFLEEAVDAVGDALVAESVYQVVRGNPLRAASTVDSIAGGETPPPELEVVRTPRTGVALTHRLLILFSGKPALSAAWAQPENPVRANAEPHLNAWAGNLLGNPSKLRCLIDRLDTGTGAVLESKELGLDQLHLTPLDFIYAIEGGQGGQKAELEQRILYTITRQPNGFAPGSLLRINPNRKPEWTDDELGYGEFSELLRTVRKLFSGVRGIDDEDLNPPDRTTNLSIDIAELEKRASTAEQALRRILKDFQAPLAASNTADLDVLRGLILRAAGFGVPGAVPLSAVGASPSDRQTLLTQAVSIQKELSQRGEQLKALGASSANTVEDRRDNAVARLRIVFGKSFIVVPRFKPANAEEIGKALFNSKNLQDGDPFAANTWFQRMARVRDGVGRLNAALSYAEALNTGEKLKLSVAQLPFDAADRWVGLPLKDGKSIPGGKLSLVVQSAAPTDVRQPLAGVLIDEWVEVVPAPKETTGIALQYDQPNSAPPQTILIAVPPEIESPWTIWSLQQVLLETLDLARIRAVDLDALGDVGHYLPALYFAFNTGTDTVSTDFTKIK